jgi:hypothetical protein
MNESFTFLSGLAIDINKHKITLKEAAKKMRVRQSALKIMFCEANLHVCSKVGRPIKIVSEEKTINSYEQIDELVEEYNNHFPHSSLKNLSESLQNCSKSSMDAMGKMGKS